MQKFDICIDGIIFSLQKAGGVSVYFRELIECFANEKDSLTVFGKKYHNIFSKELDIEFEPESGLPVTLLRYVPFLKSLNNRAVFHSSYYRFSMSRSVVNITTVHDFTYERFSFGFRRRLHSFQKRMAILKSKGIICVSENTKRDLIKYIPCIDQTRIKVIYNGVGEEYFPVDNFEISFGFEALIDKRFILFVGDRSPYKNFDKAVGVVARCPEFSLVVVGGKEFSSDEVDMLANLKGRYFRFTGVSGEALNWLYNHAFCLLYPSSYEGFGISVIEAMKAGCPVISTNLSSIPEVAGDAALLVEQPTVDLLCEKVNLLQNEDIRLSLRERGFVQARNFSWIKCAEETYAFYQEVWEREFGEGG